MNIMPMPKRVAVLKALTNGASVRATSRMTGASKGAILRLLMDVGEFAELYQYHRLKNLPATLVSADEQWAFCGKKQRNATSAAEGDVWAYVALDDERKLIMSWLVGARSQENFNTFMADLAPRCANKIQLTTDGHSMYLSAVRAAFAFGRCDYARVVKIFGSAGAAAGEAAPARRYSPATCTGIIKERVIGRPDMNLASTSLVERLNLNTRMQCRRFTRLTNGFSRKMENHATAVALTFFSHNFIVPHGTLTKAAKGVKTTPAMASGLASHPWTWEEVLTKMDPMEAVT